MLIYFLGGESGLSDKIQTDEIGRGADCQFFAKIGSFAKAVKTKMPELILAEKAFASNGFDLRLFLKEQKIESPIIFFNRVQATGECKADVWYYQIAPFIKNNGDGRYKRCIDFLSKKMENPFCARSANDEDFLYKIKERCKIPNKLFEFFKYLYNSQDSVSIEKMREDFFSCGKSINPKSVNVYISRLKKLLSAEKNASVSLVKEYDGYKLVRYKETATLSESACPSLN